MVDRDSKLPGSVCQSLLMTFPLTDLHKLLLKLFYDCVKEESGSTMIKSQFWYLPSQGLRRLPGHSRVSTALLTQRMDRTFHLKYWVPLAGLVRMMWVKEFWS